MHDITRMLEAHPRAAKVDVERYVTTIDTLSACDITCTVCADACLSEPHVQMLARCIELNLDCADLCSTTARLLGRIGFAESEMLRAQLDACGEACRACAEECDRHQDIEHCSICADMCRSCERACAEMVDSMMSLA
ncbi:four-helix bundle copper-binding protein [bacterium]|nr:four-helix bundle copper-binding protein [bacterium]